MKNINKVISLSLATVLLANPFNAFALTKTETIYSTLGVSGNVKKTTINTKLTDISKGDIEDYTYLENIKNLNGHEKFTRDGEKLTWKSTGKDIFYSGKYNDELPVKVNIKYYLDGEEVKPRDIKGKSGTITMKINFTNNSFDSKSGMYTPFVVSTTMLIDGENNSNISISTGKVVSTGTKNVVTGISAPGLYESTNLSNFKDLDTLTISYKTTDFSTNEIYFVITPKLLSEVDLSTLDKVDSLNSSLNLLQDSMNQLESGANELRDGAHKVNDGTTLIKNTVNSTLNSLNSNLTEQERQTILNTVMSNPELSEVNIKNEADTELEKNAQYSELAKTYNYGMTKYKGGLTQYNNGLAQYNAGLAQYNEGLTNYNNALTQYGLNQAVIDSCSNEPAYSSDQCAHVKTLVDSYKKLTGSKQTLDASKAQLDSSKSTLDASKASLDQAGSVVSAIKKAAEESAIKTASKVATETALKTATIVKGQAVNETKTSLNQLIDGLGTLSNGTSALANGTDTLASGISQLNSQGINELSSIGNKAVDYKNKIATLTRLSKDYKGFASDNADTTIFVYKIAK